MKKIQNEAIKDLFYSRQRLSSSEAAKLLGISEPTCRRILNELKAIKIGKARNTQYLLPTSIDNLGDRWKLYQIDELGVAQDIGNLHHTSAGFYLNLKDNYNSLIDEEFKDGVFESLPWFLYEERPKGFIGRNIATKLNQQKDFPLDTRDWNDFHILSYMLDIAIKPPSAFMIGDKALTRLMQAQEECIETNLRESAYPRLAENVINTSGIPVSSADGEQAKFCIKKDNFGKKSNVLVKFSGKQDNPISIRIADLLITEHIALCVLKEGGFDVSKSELIFADNRVFLEYERIDRVGENGQKAMSSLSAIDSAFIGSEGGSWLNAMEKGSKYFRQEDILTIKLLYEFGIAIGNSDMHFGNLSFYIDKELPFKLAPIYDMLPMIYAPRKDNSLKADTINYNPISQEVALLAKKFWQEVQNNPHISKNFKDIAKANLNLLY